MATQIICDYCGGWYTWTRTEEPRLGNGRHICGYCYDRKNYERNHPASTRHNKKTCQCDSCHDARVEERYQKYGSLHN